MEENIFYGETGMDWKTSVFCGQRIAVMLDEIDDMAQKIILRHTNGCDDYEPFDANEANYLMELQKIRDLVESCKHTHVLDI